MRTIIRVIILIAAFSLFGCNPAEENQQEILNEQGMQIQSYQEVALERDNYIVLLEEIVVKQEALIKMLELQTKILMYRLKELDPYFQQQTTEEEYPAT